LVARHVFAAVLTFEVLQAKVYDTIVEVLATKVRVASGCFHFKNPIFNGQ